jgi:hypothetical protein
MKADALFAGSHKNSTAFSWVGLALGSKIPTDSGISAHTYTHTKVQTSASPEDSGKDHQYRAKFLHHNLKCPNLWELFGQNSSGRQLDLNCHEQFVVFTLFYVNSHFILLQKYHA